MSSWRLARGLAAVLRATAPRYGAVIATVVVSTFGCSTGVLDASPGRRAQDPPRDDGPVCPFDPDCYLSGDCVRPECPDAWTCRIESGREICVNPGPDRPDRGEWECLDVGDTTRCTGAWTDQGGSSGWSCTGSSEFAECEKPRDLPDDGGGAPWSCEFDGEFRVCSRPTTGPVHVPDASVVAEGGAVADASFTPNDAEVSVDDAAVVGPIDAGVGPFDAGAMDAGAMDGGTTGVPVDAGRPDAGLCDDVAGGRAVFTGGELVALKDSGRDVDCGAVRVDVTGYYAIYDSFIAESCSTQRDETGFLRVRNRCNADGGPRDPNLRDIYVVEDVDNTAECTGDADCGADELCREGNASTSCCIPRAPLYLGTFLLVAGEENELCLHHFCPYWQSTGAGGRFLNAGCRDRANSVHLRLDATTFACVDEPAACP